MGHAVILDTEFLTNEDSYRRMWMGPHDPDPLVAQIGAVRLSLQDGFAIGPTFSRLVHPKDRFDRPIPLHPAFTSLTGITQKDMDLSGSPLADALSAFDVFAAGAPIWSWGKDELYLMAISPWIAGIPAPLLAHRFGNASGLLLHMGVPLEDLKNLRSHTLCAYFGLTPPNGTAHDAGHDALSVASVLQHLLLTGRLSASDLRNTAP